MIAMASAAPSLPVEDAKVLLERDGYKMLDVRSWKAYDREHLTKPPQCTANVPLADDEDPAAPGGFVAKVTEQGFRPGSKLLVARTTTPSPRFTPFKPPHSSPPPRHSHEAAVAALKQPRLCVIQAARRRRPTSVPHEPRARMLSTPQ